MIGTIIRTDLEQTEQVAANQPMPIDPDDNGLVCSAAHSPNSACRVGRACYTVVDILIASSLTSQCLWAIECLQFS